MSACGERRVVSYYSNLFARYPTRYLVPGTNTDIREGIKYEESSQFSCTAHTYTAVWDVTDTSCNIVRNGRYRVSVTRGGEEGLVAQTRPRVAA